MVIRKKLLSLIIFPLYLIAHENWETTNLIWNFGLINSCNVGNPEDPRKYFKEEPHFDLRRYQTVKSGDVVWIQPNLIKDFCQKVLPQIQTPFVLVISDGDASFPSDCLSNDQFDDLLANPYIIHIFAQNCDYHGDSNKVSRIPLGIDFHTVAYKGTSGGWGMIGSPKQQEHKLMQQLNLAPPTSKRKLRAYVDFQHSDTMHGDFKRYLQFGEDRASIFQKILQSGVIDYGPWTNRADLWKIKREYAFSISPPGNGLDCHRTWEDLALGCIVIVKSSPINSLFDGLPVVIINDWDEIHADNLHRWMVQYGDASTNPLYREKLSNHYWITKIENKAKPYKLND